MGDYADMANDDWPGEELDEAAMSDPPTLTPEPDAGADEPPADEGEVCEYARSDMTPCVIKDGECAQADDGACVGCGRFVTAPQTSDHGMTYVDIYAPRGTHIRLNHRRQNGSKFDWEHADKHLEMGVWYSLDRADIHASSTDFYLQGVPGEHFNSVIFETHCIAPQTSEQDTAEPWRSFCPQCGPDVGVDEDGCCATCGATACGEWAHRAAVALKQDTAKQEPADSTETASLLNVEFRYCDDEIELQWWDHEEGWVETDAPVLFEIIRDAAAALRDKEAALRKAQVSEDRWHEESRLNNENAQFQRARADAAEKREQALRDAGNLLAGRLGPFSTGDIEDFLVSDRPLYDALNALATQETP